MLTVQNLGEVHRTHGGGDTPQRERRGDSITLLGRGHQGEGEGMVVDPTMISLVLRFQSPEV